MRLLENRDAGGRNYCTSTTQAERIEKGRQLTLVFLPRLQDAQETTLVAGLCDFRRILQM